MITKKGWLKRGISALLAGVMCVSVAGITAFAAENEGSDEALEAGVYTVPIVSLTSGAPLPAVQNAFNGAFGDSVTVTVEESGAMTAKIQNHHMVIDFAGMMGLGAFDANVAWIKDANVLSTKQEVWSNVDGNLMGDPIVTEIEVPDEFEITLALDDNGAQKLTVGVDFMAGMYQKPVEEYSTTVTLTLDMTSAERVVNRSALEALVEEAKEYQADSYTEESFADLVSEIEKAEELLASDSVSQEDIDSAVAALQAAIDALEENIPKEPEDPSESENPEDTTTPDDTETPDTTEDETIDIKNLADGVYEIPVALWHATEGRESMAATSLNGTARLVVKDGNITLYIYTKPMTFGTITASLQEMKVEQDDGSWLDAIVEDRSDDGDPICFSVTISELAEYINVKVNPHVEMMGNTDLDARLKFDLSAIKLISQPTDEKPLDPPEENDTDTTVTPNDVNTPQNSNNPDDASNPQTGDASEFGMKLLLILVSAAGMLGIVALRKNKARIR